MYGSPLMRRLRNCYTGKHKYFTEDVWIPRCESLATKHDGNKYCTYLNRGAIQYLVNIFNTQWQYWCHINGYYYKILGIYHATPCMEIFRILVPQEILPRVNLLRNHALKAGICERVRVQAGAGARACVPSISCSVSCSSMPSECQHIWYWSRWLKYQSLYRVRLIGLFWVAWTCLTAFLPESVQQSI